MAVKNKCDMKIEFNYFSEGQSTEGESNIPVSFNSLPVWTIGNNKLSVQDDAKAIGFWFAMPEILPNCAGGEFNSICGHYHERGCPSNDPNVKLGGIFPIVVAAPR